MAGRLFNEKEVREILKRVSAGPDAKELGEPDGISLEELQQIGTELGLDPRRIEAAAQEIGPAVSARTGFMNGRVVLDRTVEGEVSVDDWLGMVAVIQRYFKGVGAVTQRGSNYDWAGTEEGGSLALTVNVRDGRSRIRLESNRWLEVLMAAVFCPVFALVFASVLIKHGHAIGAGLVVFFFAGLLFGIIRFARTYHLQTALGIMERLINEVQSSNSSTPLSTPIGPITDRPASEQTLRS